LGEIQKKKSGVDEETKRPGDHWGKGKNSKREKGPGRKKSPSNIPELQGKV